MLLTMMMMMMMMMLMTMTEVVIPLLPPWHRMPVSGIWFMPNLHYTHAALYLYLYLYIWLHAHAQPAQPTHLLMPH